MEVLKISDNKLKIMMSRQDMEKFGLRADKVDYNDAATRRSFFEIMDSVKNSHGFETEGDKILIQFYPSKDGGCELFVTKLGLLPQSSEKTISKSDRVTMLTTRRELYVFSNINNLIRAVKALGCNSDIKYSDVFYDEETEGGRYILEVMERGSGRGIFISELDLLLEFSERADNYIYPYITEHYKKLTQGDAIEQYSNY
jgi:negative regulator of genetic competence, sporulation and motility